MCLVVVHKSISSGKSSSDSLLRLAFSGGPVTDVIISGVSEYYGGLCGDNLTFAIPGEWKLTGSVLSRGVLSYNGKTPIPPTCLSLNGNSWLVISDGRFFAQANLQLLYETIAKVDSDVVAVNVEPRLKAGHEKILTDLRQNLVGIRLLYADAIQPAPIYSDWPHHLFVRSNVISRLFKEGTMPETFSEFLNVCHSVSVNITGIGIGGTTLDLNTEQGLLSLLSGGLGKKTTWHGNSPLNDKMIHNNGIKISNDARLFGEITFGRNVTIGANAIIAGPAVIDDGVNIADRAVILECIIGPNVSVPSGCVLQNRVITDSCGISGQSTQAVNESARRNLSDGDSCLSRYRIWPKFSYVGCIKRIADIIIAATVLVVFAPVLPFVALAVKLSSPGPVFFKDMRQGLHGKSFPCLKFRTMLVGADRMQEKLRALNEADGPQFVIADDPRMSKVGRFLRETYVDEIPQFLSILLGHMSIVGPRPSPESENVLCPFWRDARLSVRPGLTGLWQVCRTRQPMKDFQEWIHYDIEYVRNLSAGLDLWICWQTAKKMFLNFLSQF
jgi:lipopolysaccharide/colanic/teichoic acid biosynthesis glycosyltransferase/acetyltransferase-like isoleucine patch superfamily enzyme